MGSCQSSSQAATHKDAVVVKAKTKKADLKKSKSTVVLPGFQYHKGTCALEYWDPIREIAQGSISTIHLVQRRPHRVKIPYREKGDIMSSSSKKPHHQRNSKTKTKPPNEQDKEDQSPITTLIKDSSVATDKTIPVVTVSDGPQELYALKSIIKEFVGNDRYLQEMRAEIHTMSRLDHPHIAKVYEAYERHRHIYLIMEYCSGGNLCDRIYDEPIAAVILGKLASAIAYLHERNVVHRDIKLENIMFDKPGEDGAGEVKIIDFGLATRYLSDSHKKLTDRVGTLYSMAPQVLQGVYDAKCDLWSLGVVAYLLLSGNQPFWGPPREMPWEERKKIMMDRILRCDYKRMTMGKWSNISQEAKSFIRGLLQMDPNKRLSAKQALQHKWIQKYYDPTMPDGVRRVSPSPSLDLPLEPPNKTLAAASEDGSNPSTRMDSENDNCDGDDEPDEILATPQNTVVPGGCNCEDDRACCFSFDASTNSMRRTNPLEDHNK